MEVMLNPNVDRKAAVRAYKERKVRPGIYAVREIETGNSWAGSALDLDSTKNGLWHALNAGRHLDKGLQEKWNLFTEGALNSQVQHSSERMDAWETTTHI